MLLSVFVCVMFNLSLQDFRPTVMSVFSFCCYHGRTEFDEGYYSASDNSRDTYVYTAVGTSSMETIHKGLKQGSE
jgi:hypothetical protein